MAISYGIVGLAADSDGNIISPGSKGGMGRVYDVNMASADTPGTVTFTQTVEGATVGFRFLPIVAFITPMDVVLTATQVLAANGGGGAAGTFANGTGTTSQSTKVTALNASQVDFAKGGSAAASFRLFVGQLYVNERS